MKNKERSRYYTNKSVKKKIDKMLEQNARNQSSLGTGSQFDIGQEESDLAWNQFEKEIKELDPELYDIIKKQND
jgi:hypothetical protein|tara:strand:+ start:13503 stop:13724 length:222 start_codon:yes stop_codon:yes gene_type:complete